MTFTSAATIQYDQDFKCAEDNAIFAYFDTRHVAPPDFHLVQIEQPAANLVQNWIAPYADNFGQQMVAGQLGQGFTVIQDASGTTDFTMGHLSLGKRPFHPPRRTARTGSPTRTFERRFTSGERDFLGPDPGRDGSGRALYMQMHLDGVPRVQVFIVPKAEGDASLQLYFGYGPVGPLAYPPRFVDAVASGAEYERSVPVPPGMYYVVLDNTPSPGEIQTPAPLLGGAFDAPAVVSYAIQIGGCALKIAEDSAQARRMTAVALMQTLPDDRARMNGAVQGERIAEAATAEAPRTVADLPPVTRSRLLRLVYWIVWFGAVPILVASFLIWALTPQAGFEAQGAAGLFGWGRGLVVHSQPVPVGIVLFTVVEIALGSLKLCLSSRSTPIRRFVAILPSRLRGSVRSCRGVASSTKRT